MSEARDTVRRLEEAWAANDLATVDELIAPDLVSHDAPPGMPPGREGAKAAHQMAMTSFPDRRMTIEEVIGDGDRVAVRTTIHGTNTGGVPRLGVPANGRKMDIESISIYGVENGKVGPSHTAGPGGRRRPPVPRLPECRPFPSMVVADEAAEHLDERPYRALGGQPDPREHRCRAARRERLRGHPRLPLRR